VADANGGADGGPPPLGGGEAVIPDALLYYQHNTDTDRSGRGSMLRAFV
jgi:hypothetical protein